MKFLLRKLLQPRIWGRIMTERLCEPLHLNVISLFVALFGTFRAKVWFDLILRPHNAYALLKVADQAKALGLITKVPRIVSVQAAGAAPFARAFREDFATRYTVQAETIATAIRIGDPASWDRAVKVDLATGRGVRFEFDAPVFSSPAMMDAYVGMAVFAQRMTKLAAPATAPGGIVGLWSALIARWRVAFAAPAEAFKPAPVEDLAPLLKRARESLEAQGLSIRFGGVQAVSNLSFEAAPGQVTSLIGPNGAGKTTALNMLSGFYRPSSGGFQLGARMRDRSGDVVREQAPVIRNGFAELLDE